MRQALAIAVMLGAAGARADRLIDVFTARRVPQGQVRAEWLVPVGGAKSGRTSVNIGLTPLVDVEAIWDRSAGGSAATFSGSFNLLPAVRDFSPGISVGIRDALDRTDQGRAAFVAFTYRASLANDLVDTLPVDLTLGADTRNGAYAGVFLPFSDHLVGIAELANRRATAGVELRPVRGLGLRWLFRQSETLVGAWYSVRL